MAQNARANDNNAGDDKMIVTLSVGELRAVVRDEVERLKAVVPQLPSKWVDTPKAAEHFGCTTQTIRNWIEQGAPATQVGTGARPKYRIELHALEAWCRAQGK